MVNKTHFKIARRGAQAWNQWREGKPQIYPDLTLADLSYLNLFWANLSRANLLQANLKGADLYQANLALSDLSYANLSRSDLTGADLHWANLSNANLNSAELNGANLNATNLNGADLKWADFRGADLIEANLSYAQLGESDLTKANLEWANLRHANLKGALLKQSNLSLAHLNSSNLEGAFLNQANLHRANLSGADLRDANLSGASLTHANLSAVNLSAANLSEVDFEQVVMNQTILADNDLSSIKGLDTVEHRGPSTVGLNTVYRSKGNIPEKFLRGCGLSDWEIEMAKLYRPNQSLSEFTDLAYKIIELRSNPLIQFYSCFISYSHDDVVFARRLHDALQGNGIRCWLDEHQLLPGDKIYTEVDRGIRLWDKVLLCCSKSALKSWWVDNEIDTAFEKEQTLRRERGKEVLALIPLNLDGYLFSAECSNSKAGQIRTRLAADFIGWHTDNRKFEEQFKRLMKALRADAGGRASAPKPKL